MAKFRVGDVVDKGVVTNVRRVQGEWWYTVQTNDGWFIDPDDKQTRRHDPFRIAYEVFLEEQLQPK